MIGLVASIALITYLGVRWYKNACKRPTKNFPPGKIDSINLLYKFYKITTNNEYIFKNKCGSGRLAPTEGYNTVRISEL